MNLKNKKMNTILYVIVFMLYINIGFSQTSSIQVKIKGITNINGKIEIGLFNKKEGFPNYKNYFKGASVLPAKNEVQYAFKNISEGTYAIAVFHDEDENKELNKNIFGAPSEKYGFSLNQYGTMGPPNFNKVAFTITKNKDTTLIINLK